MSGNEGKGTQKTQSKSFQIVSFTVGNEEYGVHIEEVQEIVRMPVITKLPQTASFIKGVINLRGNVIPVIDMRERFGMEKKTYSEMTRVIVTKIEEKLIGMIVDQVSQVLELSQDDVSEAPDIIHGLSREYIEGIGRMNESMIIILRIQKVLTAEEIIAVGAVEQQSA
jgi:purine-binding chemotaxis protein CheW